MREKLLWIICFGFLISFAAACASTQTVRTQAVGPGEVTGTYTVILYGGPPIPNDPQRVAFLDLQGDKYTINVNAREGEYRVIRDLPADRAVAVAREFLRAHPYFVSPDLRRITDAQGSLIGYEMLPNYFPLSYGTTDVLRTSFVLLGNDNVTVSVTVNPDVDRRFSS